MDQSYEEVEVASNASEEKQEGSKQLAEVARRQAQSMIEWLDDEMSAVPIFAKVQRVTGISAAA